MLTSMYRPPASRSASADDTPGTVLTTRWMSLVTRSICSVSMPATFTPTGLLIPVASMSMRLRIGGTQIFESPGTVTIRSSSSTNLSVVIPARHCSRGLNWIVVSNISIGAGSVAVSARPALPKTLCTSGTVLINRSVCCNNSATLPVAMLGSADGMYRRSPSSSGGMNSPPSCESGHAVATRTSRATNSVDFGYRNTVDSDGRYAAMSPRLSGFVCSSGI